MTNSTGMPPGPDEQADSSLSSNPQAADGAAPAHGAGGPPPDSGRLAGRIARWATNLLATCVVLVAALTFGRQTIHWWQSDRDGSGPGGARSILPNDHMGHDSLLHRIESGELPGSIERQGFTGPREDAFAVLRSQCRRVVERGGVPGHAQGPWETEMLATLGALDAAERIRGGGRIYQLDGPVLLVAAVRRTGEGETDNPRPETIEVDGRVVCWGIGLPGQSGGSEADRSWTLLTCDATARPAASVPAEVLPALPPGSRRTLAVHVEGGGWLIGFQGSGSIVAAEHFFDDWHASQGRGRAGHWQQLDNTRHARYPGPGAGWTDIHLTWESADRHSGILVITPHGVGGQR